MRLGNKISFIVYINKFINWSHAIVNTRQLVLE